MKKLIQQLFRFLTLALLLSSLTSCCGFRIHVSPCFKNFRRPQIMVTKYNNVIAYDTCPRLIDDHPIIEEFPCGMDPRRIEHEEPQEHIFSVGDAMEVSVFGDEETSVEAIQVAPDGNIYYLFLDAIPAAGLTVTQLSQELVDRLHDYYVDPLVSIAPKTALDRTYKILGRVYGPGVYPITSPMRLRDAIGDAGGVMTATYDDNQRGDVYSLADLRESLLIRNHQRIPVDFEKLLTTADESNNIPIKPGDYIYIASAEHKEVYVLGALNAPQRITYYQGLTAMAALAYAGGWLSGNPYAADPSRVIVIRGSLNCPCVMQMDLCQVVAGQARDIYLQPGDIVYAANKTMRLGRELVRIAIATFLQSFSSAAASYWANQRWFN